MQPSGRPAGPDPHDRRPTVVAVSVALVIAAAALAAVFVLDPGSGGAGSAHPPLSAATDLSGQSYVVGGKDISEEQSILCEITAAALREARATVTRRCEIGGTDATRQALLDGGIDIYWEYTGTAWQVFLGQTAKIPDPGRLYEEVRQRDLRENDVVWTARADVDDTYAFATAGEAGAGITSLSAMAAHIRSGAPGDVCVEREYATRPDGLGNMARAYGVTIPPDRLRVLDGGDIYQATARGECLFGEVYSTDGRIPGLGLRVLADDKGFHTTYNPAPTLRRSTYERAPQVARVLDPVAGALDQPTMVALNGQVSGQGRDPRAVALDWLAAQGFVPAPR